MPPFAAFNVRPVKPLAPSGRPGRPQVPVADAPPSRKLVRRSIRFVQKPLNAKLRIVGGGGRSARGIGARRSGRG